MFKSLDGLVSTSIGLATTEWENDTTVGIKKVVDFERKIMFPSKQRKLFLRLVDVIDAPDGQVFLIMPLYRHNLGSCLKDMNFSQKLTVARQALEGLKYLHGKGIIHGGCKCNNLLLNDLSHVVWTDVGTTLSTEIPKDGTQYCAPEFYDSNGEFALPLMLSTKADVFAFGAILKEIESNSKVFTDAIEDAMERRILSPLREKNNPVSMIEEIVSTTKSSDSIVKIMSTHWEDSKVQQSGCFALSVLDHFENNASDAVLKAMEIHEVDIEVQYYGLMALLSLGFVPLPIILYTMDRYPLVSKIQIECCKLLSLCTTYDKTIKASLLKTMEHHEQDEQVYEAAVGALMNLSIINRNLAAKTEILNSMKQHPKSARIQELGCGFLMNIKCFDPLVNQALDNHKQCGRVIANAFGSLKYSQTFDEGLVAALMVIHVDDESVQRRGCALSWKTTIEPVLVAMDAFRGNGSIQEKGVKWMLEFKCLDHFGLVLQAMKHHLTNDAIQYNGAKVLLLRETYHEMIDEIFQQMLLTMETTPEMKTQIACCTVLHDIVMNNAEKKQKVVDSKSLEFLQLSDEPIVYFYLAYIITCLADAPNSGPLVSIVQNRVLHGMALFPADIQIQEQGCAAIAALAKFHDMNFAKRVVVTALNAFLFDEKIQECGLRAVAALRMESEQQRIEKAMIAHPHSALVQLSALQALCSQENVNFLLVSKAIENNPTHVEIQIAGCKLIATLAQTQRDELVFKRQVHRMVFTALNITDNADIQSEACCALMHLAVSKEIQLFLLKADADRLIVRAMNLFPLHSQLQEHGCHALWNLSGIFPQMLCPETLKAILSAMQLHVENPDIQESACGTLTNLAGCLDLGDEIGDTMLRTMKLHRNSPQVLESACGLLMNMPLPQIKAVSSIVEAMRMHESHVGLQEMGCGALASLVEHLDDTTQVAERAMTALSNHSQDVAVQENALAVLSAVPFTKVDSKLVLRAMDIHLMSSEVQINACKILAGSGKVRDRAARAMQLHKNNVYVQVQAIPFVEFELIQDALNKHSTNEHVCTAAFKAFSRFKPAFDLAQVARALNNFPGNAMLQAYGLEILYLKYDVLDPATRAIQRFPDNEFLLERACAVIASSNLEDQTIKPHLLKLMQNHEISPKILTHACAGMSKLCAVTELPESNELRLATITIMEKYPEHSELLEKALDVVGNLGGDTSGFNRHVAFTMKNHLDHQGIQEAGCAAFISWPIVDFAPEVLAAMIRFQNVPSVLTIGCGALGAMAVNEENIAVLQDLHVEQIIVQAVTAFPNDIFLQQNAIAVLGLIQAREGYSAIFKAMDRFSEVVGLQENCLMAIANLNSDAVMKNFQVSNRVAQLLRKFKDHPGIQHLGSMVLKNIHNKQHKELSEFSTILI